VKNQERHAAADAEGMGRKETEKGRWKIMKIAIPVDNRTMGTSICPSFGRAPYYMIYDTETKGTEFMDNSAAESQGGAGVKAAQAVVDTGAKVLITPRCGENAEQVLKSADIKVYKAIQGKAMGNIEAFLESRLEILSDYHAGFHGHGRQ